MDEHDFPFRPGNCFHLLVNGQRFFPVMLDAIRGASRQIVMEMYLVESGRIANQFSSALIEAARRGVSVQLLLDAFGCRALSGQDREQLVQGGVQLIFYNPLQLRRPKKNLLRTHRKFLVIDAAVAYVGGTGITDFFAGEGGWRETMLEARGPVVADWQTLFARNWENCTGTPALPAMKAPASGKDQRGRVVWTERGSTHLEIKRSLLNRTAGARQRVWVATAYFVPSRKVRRALRRAAMRGVDTRLLVPGPVTDHPAVRFASRRFYARLLRHGVRIFEYKGRFMHSKVALTDNWSSIGSSNLDRWNLRWNLEANQEVDDRDFAGEVAQMLLEDFRLSHEIDYRQWQQRSVIHRLKEWLWGKVDILLSRWKPH
jgi:phosphatidylserine/phosphatidylglycerophosphate/cardiolipin synthase-like enzyme